MEACGRGKISISARYSSYQTTSNIWAGFDLNPRFWYCTHWRKFTTKIIPLWHNYNRHVTCDNSDYSCGDYRHIRVRKYTWGGAINGGRRKNLKLLLLGDYGAGLTATQNPSAENNISDSDENGSTIATEVHDAIWYKNERYVTIPMNGLVPERDFAIRKLDEEVTTRGSNKNCK